MFLRIVFGDYEGNSIAETAKSMASYGIDCVTRSVQYNPDRSASKADVFIHPPMNNLIFFERVSNDCATLPDFFKEPSPEIRQSFKAALDKLKKHHRTELSLPAPPGTVVRSPNERPNYVSQVSSGYTGHFQCSKKTGNPERNVKKLLGIANSLRLKFNQGFSNAIRRSVSIGDFL